MTIGVMLNRKAENVNNDSNFVKFKVI